MGRGTGAQAPPASNTDTAPPARERAVVEVIFQRPLTQRERTELDHWLDELPYYLPRDDWDANLFIRKWEPQEG